MHRAEGALVARLSREPSRRELRYAHLLGPASAQPSSSAPPEPPAMSEASEVAAVSVSVPMSSAAAPLPLESRVSALERTVARLAAELEQLRRNQ